jgi:hypothetical protein
MKYIIIILLVLSLVYVYMHSSLMAGSSAGSSSAGSANTNNANNTSPGIATGATAPVISSANGTVGPVGPNGWPLMAANGIPAGSGSVQIGETATGVPVYGGVSATSNSVAPVISASTASSIPNLPSTIDQTMPITPIGTSSLGYKTYTATSVSGDPVILGVKNGQSVVISGGNTPQLTHVMTALANASASVAPSGAGGGGSAKTISTNLNKVIIGKPATAPVLKA